MVCAIRNERNQSGSFWKTNRFILGGWGKGIRREHADRVPVSEPWMPPNGGTPWLQQQGWARDRAQRARLQGKREVLKTCFLRNEPICNVEESAFISLVENELDRLQKNDKWLRFFRSRRKAPERADRVPVSAPWMPPGGTPRLQRRRTARTGTTYNWLERGREPSLFLAFQYWQSDGSLLLRVHQQYSETLRFAQGDKQGRAKAGVDLMNRFLYIMWRRGGAFLMALPHSIVGLPRNYIVRHLADSASNIHSI